MRSLVTLFSGLFCLGLAAVMVGLSGCGDDGEAAAKGGRPPMLVRVGQLERKPVSRKIVVVGNVTPVRTSIVASGANGVVEHLREDPELETTVEIEQGQYVTQGTVLSKLRMESTKQEVLQAEAMEQERHQTWLAVKDTHPEEVAHATAMMRAADAVETNASQKLERTESLFRRGAATDAELEDAQEKAKAAIQALTAAQKTLQRVKSGRDIELAKLRHDAQVAEVARLHAERNKRTTKAPFDGFVTMVHTYEGQWLSKGDPVITLAKMDEVDVMVNVDQSDIPYVRLGQTASVLVRGATPDYWTGRIVQIVPKSNWEQGSRGFPVVVRIKNPIIPVEIEDESGAKHTEMTAALKAGMMAEVTILASPVDTLLAPKDALVRTTQGTKIYVFTPKETGAQPDPKKPTTGNVKRLTVNPQLALSEGEMIGVEVVNDSPENTTTLDAGMWVVTEGGERFVGPLQNDVAALSAFQVSEEAEETEPEKPKRKLPSD